MPGLGKSGTSRIFARRSSRDTAFGLLRWASGIVERPLAQSKAATAPAASRGVAPSPTGRASEAAFLPREEAADVVGVEVPDERRAGGGIHQVERRELPDEGHHDHAHA